MTISVEGDADLGVSQSFTHDFRMDALPQEVSCVRVPEVVEPDPTEIGSADKCCEGRGYRRHVQLLWFDKGIPVKLTNRPGEAALSSEN